MALVLAVLLLLGFGVGFAHALAGHAAVPAFCRFYGGGYDSVSVLIVGGAVLAGVLLTSSRTELIIGEVGRAVDVLGVWIKLGIEVLFIVLTVVEIHPICTLHTKTSRFHVRSIC